MKPSKRKLKIINKMIGKDTGIQSEIAKLIDKHGHWGQYDKYDREDWKYEITNSYTNLGYWEWVVHQIEAEDA